MPVGNNEHQRIDDVSSDLISNGIQSLETIGFALWNKDFFYFVQTSQWASQLVIICYCKNLSNFKAFQK